MAHYEINHSPVPIRLFKSDFMEFFTHIHPAVVIAIWLPTAVGFLAYSIVNSKTSWVHIPVGFLAGIIMWTFTEYTLHRFLFHFQAKSPEMEKLFFLFHGVHHAQPQCKTRLVMPPIISVPLALIFYGLFYLIFAVILDAPHWIAPLVSGFIIGYLAYDLTHYATHHLPMRTGVFRFLKRYHMMHHYKTPNARYGVSSPLWDIVFGTKPE